jgi:hypothetical protein
LAAIAVDGLGGMDGTMSPQGGSCAPASIPGKSSVGVGVIATASCCYCWGDRQFDHCYYFAHDFILTRSIKLGTGSVRSCLESGLES